MGKQQGRKMVGMFSKKSKSKPPTPVAGAMPPTDSEIGASRQPNKMTVRQRTRTLSLNNGPKRMKTLLRWQAGG